MKIMLYLRKKNGKLQRYQTDKKRRISHILALDNYVKGYLKVLYGKQLDIHNKMVEFYNDAHFDNKKDAVELFSAFTE